MPANEGVCNICALICHKGHDLKYEKLSNFYCDCFFWGGCTAVPPDFKIEDSEPRGQYLKNFKEIDIDHPFPLKKMEDKARFVLEERERLREEREWLWGLFGERRGNPFSRG